MLKFWVILSLVECFFVGVWFEMWWFYVELIDFDEGFGEMFIFDIVVMMGCMVIVDSEWFFVRSG